MDAQRLDFPREHRIRLDPVEHVQAPVQVFLVFAEVEIYGAEDVPRGDLAVERGEEKPRAQVVARCEAGDAVPDFGRGALGGRGVGELKALSMGERGADECEREHTSWLRCTSAWVSLFDGSRDNAVWKSVWDMSDLRWLVLAHKNQNCAPAAIRTMF